MADSGKQSPLGVNVIGSLLAGHNINLPDGTTFFINPVAESYFGKSKNNSDYTPGSIVNDTCLKWVTYALKEAWGRTPMNGVSGEITAQTYDAMLNIGQSRIPALGNSKPPSYQVDDPTGFWQVTGAANTGLAIEGDVDHGQDASWDPWDSGDPAGSNPNSEVTKWGWVRAMALQAFNEFWYNAPVGTNPAYDPDPQNSNISYNPSYKDFTASFLTADNFIKYSNQAIFAIQNSQTFLQGTFSNQDDLVTADIAGVSLSSRALGQDLINLGNAIDFTYIQTFGMPSTIIQILQKNNALTQSVILALLTSGLSQGEINNISTGNITPTKDQEQKIYGALLVIVGTDLEEVLVILNCKTKGLTSLADLVSVKKMFPVSYRTLTVPIYNTNPGPTNAKTYYLLFINDELNPQLVLPRIKEIVKTIVPPQPPPIVIEPPPAPPPPPPEPPIVIPQPPVVPIPEPPPPPPLPVPPIIVDPIIFPTALPTGGGGCVVLESYVPQADKRIFNGREVRQAWQLYEGYDISLGMEDDTLLPYVGSVNFNLVELQPCVRVVTEQGISLLCSTTAPIFTKDLTFVNAPDLFGKEVACMKHNETFFDKVISVEHIGERFVCAINAGGKAFWAGEKDGMYLLHHNVNIEKERNSLDKK